MGPAPQPGCRMADGDPAAIGVSCCCNGGTKTTMDSTMLCHECARNGRREPAVALCRSCLIGLCEAHLAEEERRAGGLPRFGCHHLPAPGRRHTLPFEAGWSRAALLV